jgi:uncharacterized membrane protein YgaE (UPF0421/DUF939 family)
MKRLPKLSKGALQWIIALSLAAVFSYLFNEWVRPNIGGFFSGVIVTLATIVTLAITERVADTLYKED